MGNSVEEASESGFRWLHAFKSGDINGMLDEMHFPHIRISGQNEIQIWNSRDDQIARHDGMTERLRSEDWIQTITSDLRAVQEGPDKVDLAMKQFWWSWRDSKNGFLYVGYSLVFPYLGNIICLAAHLIRT